MTDNSNTTTQQQGKTMADLPPEVLNPIWEYVTRNEKLNNILVYRLVNKYFKDIFDSYIENKIISCQLPVFPGMKVSCTGGGYQLFHVRQSISMFSTTGFRNLFPFNSLLLTGNEDEIKTKYFTDIFPDTQKRTIGLPEFISKFGGNLTSFALHDVTIPGTNCLVTLLGSMPNLTRLGFKGVTLNDQSMEPNVSVPMMTLPPMPNLCTFELKGGCNHFPYLCLIARYADTLERLTLDTEEYSLPTLQKCRQYSDSLANGKSLYTVTNSDSAFANVTELEMNRVSKNFLRDSDFPNLKRLSITSLERNYNWDIPLQDVTHFISKCRKTLEILRLDVNWEVLIAKNERKRAQEGSMPQTAFTPCGTESSCPKLKTLEIHFPEQYTKDMIIPRFLSLFHALKHLQFLNFPIEFISTNDELEMVNDALTSKKQLNHAAQIAALKRRLALLEYDRPPVWQIFNHQREELNDIFKRFAALGEKKQDVVIQRFLDVQGVWNICPDLKAVSVISGISNNQVLWETYKCHSRNR